MTKYRIILTDNDDIVEDYNVENGFSCARILAKALCAMEVL